ncbi:nuclear pore complex protein Nup160-like isoform X2 [Cherax quadricarinatus]
MSGQQLGFREVLPHQSALVQWRNITVDTGAAQSTLQDIKVPEYGGGYAFKPLSPATRNRYLFWRVCHDVVELWEESLDYDFTHNHVQLRFADTPVLEGLSVHETHKYVYILLATVSSVHRIRLPHPQTPQGSRSKPESILKELTFQTLKEYHNLHILNSSTAGEGLPHTAGTHLMSREAADAVFVLGQTGGTLLVVKMIDMPYSVFTETIKNASLMNRLFTGFVPGMFRGLEGCETVTSLVVKELAGDVLAVGACRDGKVRAWSCTRLQCILAHDTLENTAEAGRKLNPGAQRHQIRSCGQGEDTILGVFLNFTEKHLLIIYQPTVNLGQIALSHMKTLYPPQYDLVDFSLTSWYIWTLWTDANNETQVLYAPVKSEEGSKDPPGLSSVVLEASPEKEVSLTDPFLDPREVYLRELFMPNRFSAHTIRKALGIYRRSVDFSSLAERGMWRLQEEVEAALRDQVEARLSANLSDEEITQITLEAWATFYSHTLQYQQVGHKPVGIVGVGSDWLVGVVRKQVVSWVRPMDALEVVALGPVDTLSAASLDGVLSEDAVVSAAVVALAKPLHLVREAIPLEVASAFTLDLHHLQPPDQVAASITASLLADSAKLSSDLGKKLASVSGLVAGLRAYLHALQLDMGMPDALTLENGIKSSGSLSGALSGRAGAAIIGAVVAQVAKVRLELCRDLLLLQQVALHLGHKCRLTPDAAAQLRSTLLPKTALLTQAYFALLHVSTAAAIQPSQATLEAGKRQLAALSLGSCPGMVHALPSAGRPATVLEQFFMSSGGDQSRALVGPSLDDTGSGHPSGGWAQLLMPLAMTVAQLAWPISRCLILVEWLVWGGQHGTVQEYVRLLQPWCEWNSCSRKFLLGVALLNQGEAIKAARLLLSALEGVITEDFLGVKVAGGGPETPPDQLRVMYCLRVIRLLEQSGQPALALQVAQEGVAMASSDHPSMSALYSVVFKHHLELHHHDEAFTALLACPDQHRRRNCLRQLIVSLHDRKCLTTLVGYQYGSLESDVITILENRARSADILVNNYYDLLYAFHISKHNYKKAAYVMYECALRLNVEGVGENGLRQQAKCYLACLNCLRHIPPEQAWIVKPLPRSAEDGIDNNESRMIDGTSPKRSSDGVSVAPPLTRRQAQVKVLELTHIEREYELVHARLKMVKTQPDIPSSGGPLSAADTISLLTHGRLFREAVRLARLFEHPVTPVLKGLAHACLHPLVPRSSVCNSQEENGIIRESIESEGWWTLLKELLEEEERANQSVLHHAVVSVLLQHTASLPAWLVNSYKTRNCGELLQLYVTHGLLEEAVKTATLYIDGVLGHGTKQVGLRTALHAAAPPVWLPYTALDKLLLELREVQQNKLFSKLSAHLHYRLKVYRQELEQVSQSRVILLQE